MTYTCIKQHDITDCGASCLATVSKMSNIPFIALKRLFT